MSSRESAPPEAKRACCCSLKLEAADGANRAMDGTASEADRIDTACAEASNGRARRANVRMIDQ